MVKSIVNRLTFISFFLLLWTCELVYAEQIGFDDPWGEFGFNVLDQNSSGVEIIHSLQSVKIEDIDTGHGVEKVVTVPGILLPNNAFAPNLPGTGRFLAIPRHSKPTVEILDSRSTVIQDIDIAPAPEMKMVDDDSGLEFIKDPEIYSTDAYYPAKPVTISQPSRMRGMDYVILGITPFRYNPVDRKLIIYHDLRIKVSFNSGSEHFGEDRLRNRFWENLYRSQFLNYSYLPNYRSRNSELSHTQGGNWEYVIIVPDDSNFIACADTLRKWRIKQGISTGVVTLSQIGGNDSTSIKNYINHAYFKWEIPPVAVLLLGDYADHPDDVGIFSPLWHNLMISDNIYSDMSGNGLPDLVISRITARDSVDLAITTNKILNYERFPSMNADFYQHPMIAAAWQDERWFVLCGEVVYGFLNNELGKSPVREYAIHSGTPDSTWSTNPNTYMIVDYFGPDGLGYIPYTAEYLDDWGGSAYRITNDINNGAFIAQHFDHGSIYGWNYPLYRIENLVGLENESLPFVLSINCSSGKFNDVETCFTEAMHRMEHGALGLIAATGTSISFVNDTFVWGFYDYLWQSFDPGYGHGGINHLSAFANASAKYYLKASGWPFNPEHKSVTYHLYHHHGDAFTRLYSEVPQNLSVSHAPVLFPGADHFDVSANQGATIALTVKDRIIGLAQATGGTVSIPISPQFHSDTMIVTVTRDNYRRYEQSVPVRWPEIDLIFQPVNPPISVPQGGEFQYHVTVVNGDLGAEVDGRIDLKLPNGHIFGPISAFYDRYYPPNDTTIILYAVQQIPAEAPLGDYLYLGYIGQFPEAIYDSTYFEFTVVPSASLHPKAGNWFTNAWSLIDDQSAPQYDYFLSNSPNPFNNITSIEFGLAEASYTKLEIFNLLGRKITTLVDNYLNAGRHVVNWHASRYSSGMYFYRLTSGDYIKYQKMILLK
ncbi:MAG: T9SS type A sorting domain-containing protein [candidate division Zixibacteria bacterium]|nr:T9SS type A sorting domain-containing protein [candidate division Zixibacteria bacterium]